MNTGDEHKKKSLAICYKLFNKLMSDCYVAVLLLMINCIITLSKWLWIISVHKLPTDDCLTKSSIGKKMVAA